MTDSNLLADITDLGQRLTDPLDKAIDIYLGELDSMRISATVEYTVSFNQEDLIQYISCMEETKRRCS